MDPEQPDPLDMSREHPLSAKESVALIAIPNQVFISKQSPSMALALIIPIVTSHALDHLAPAHLDQAPRIELLLRLLDVLVVARDKVPGVEVGHAVAIVVVLLLGLDSNLPSLAIIVKDDFSFLTPVLLLDPGNKVLVLPFGVVTGVIRDWFWRLGFLLRSGLLPGQVPLVLDVGDEGLLGPDVVHLDHVSMQE